MQRAAVCIFLCTAGATSANHVAGVLRHANSVKGFVKSIEFQHRLRVCNAYPNDAAIDVYRGKGEKLTGDSPMAYKTCRDFVSPLISGDKLDFRVGDASAGTFSVADLPNNDAVLLLVIHRHDVLSTAVSFESHVFANLLNAQVAVIDTYKGTQRATPRIAEAQPAGKTQARSEELRFNSVVAVNPGVYEVTLASQDGETKSQSDFVALNRESYIVLRTGVEAKEGPAYPEELVIFPLSDKKKLPHSGAAQFAALNSFLVALVLTMLPFLW